VSFIYSGQCANGDFFTMSECDGLYTVEDEHSRTVLMVAAYLLWTLAGLFVLFVTCYIQSLRIGIAVNQVALKFIAQTVHVVIIPIIVTVLSAGVFAAALVVGLLVLSQVSEDQVPTGEFADRNSAIKASEDGSIWRNDDGNFQCKLARYTVSKEFWYVVLSYFYQSSFVLAMGQLVIAGVVGLWFFSSPDARGNSKMSKFFVSRAVKNAGLYHVGTAAFGSLVLAIAAVLRCIMRWIAKKATMSGNCVIGCIACILGYLLWCLECCIAFINKEAYIYCALMGTNFCVSARNATFAVMRNPIRFSYATVSGSFVTFIGKLLIVSSSGLLGFTLLRLIEPEITHPVFLIVIFVVVAYYIADSFMNVFQLAVHTSLHCFVAVEEMGISTTSVPQELKTFLDKQDAQAAQQDEPDKK